MNGKLIRLEAGEGSAVVELNADALASLAAGDSDDSPWSVLTEPDWSGYESLRLLAATFDDGSIAALVALRPAGAAGHDAEQTVAVLVDRGKSVEDAHQALLSTELDAEGLVRRVGLELWTSDEPPPRRLAADRAHSNSITGETSERESALMEARLDGESGTAMFEVLRSA